MQIDIQTRGLILTEELRIHVERRLQFALSRFQDRVQRIAVCLSNSDSSGAALQCDLHIHVKGWPDVLIEDTEADIYVAINRAVSRAGRTLERQRLYGHLDSPS
jgi:putative sigma-54 modulation protein